MTRAVEKATLRAAALRHRAAVDPRTRLALAGVLAAIGSDLVRGAAPPHPPVASAYYPMRSEADTMPLLEALSTGGIATALPLTVHSATPLRFLAWRPGDPLQSGRHGVQEPRADAPEVTPDVLFVPLAAFDARGFRLGYGAGYYDATLAALRLRGRVLAVGVAFAVQEVPRIPAEAHDERLDAVVTEDGLRTFEAG